MTDIRKERPPSRPSRQPDRARYGEYQGVPRDHERQGREYERDAAGGRNDREGERAAQAREAAQGHRDYARENGYRRGSYEGYGPEGESRSVYGPGGYGGEERGWWQRTTAEVRSWFTGRKVPRRDETSGDR